MAECKQCNGTGKVRYYYDAGDHFGAGTAPGSEWREGSCSWCEKSAEESTVPFKWLAEYKVLHSKGDRYKEFFELTMFIEELERVDNWLYHTDSARTDDAWHEVGVSLSTANDMLQDLKRELSDG